MRLKMDGSVHFEQGPSTLITDRLIYIWPLFWQKHFRIPAKRDCIGITYVPSSYPFDQNNPALPPAAGYYIRTGPKLKQSLYSEIVYLRELTAVVTMTKPTYTGSENIEFQFISPYYPSEEKAWIGIVPASIPHGSEWENKNHVINFQNLDGSLQAKFEIIPHAAWVMHWVFFGIFQ